LRGERHLYQVEVEVFWDDQREGVIRVIASIDDPGWRALTPLTDRVLVAPDSSRE